MIALAKNPEFHKRTKHFDIRYHYVRKKFDDGQVNLEYCPTQDMLADIMTKPIVAAKFSYLRTKLGIEDVAAVESSGSVADKHLERLSCPQVAVDKDAPRHAQG